MTDRHIGYIALVVLAVGLACVAGYAVYATSAPTERRVVLCRQLGSLKLADPVVNNGKQVGVVRRIGLVGDRPCLTLQLTPPLQLHDDYAIRIVDLGVMGDRLVAVDPGSDERPLVPAGDTLRGQFVIGPSEALAIVGRLREVVSAWAKITTTLVHGDSAHEPFVNRYARFVWFIDSLSERTVSLASALDQLFSARIDTLYGLLDSAAGLSSRLSSTAPGILADMASTVETLSRVMDKADSLVAGVEDAAGVVESPDVQRLLSKLEELQTKLRAVREVLDEIRRKGINLKVWPF
jgi:ABC-type transporter Mla subunit MlaD